MPTFDDVTNGFTSQGIDALKLALGEAWDALTPSERLDATHLLATLVKARILQVVGHDVSIYLPALNAAFAQWKVVGKQVVADAVRSVATTMFGFAGAFAGSALSAVIKGAL